MTVLTARPPLRLPRIVPKTLASRCRTAPLSSLTRSVSGKRVVADLKRLEAEAHGRTSSAWRPNSARQRLTDLLTFRMEWEIVYYSEDFMRVIMEFPAGIQARYIHLTHEYSASGPTWACLTPGHGPGLVRVAPEVQGRDRAGVLLQPADRRVMMLHAFVKKSAKTPAKELRSPATG